MPTTCAENFWTHDENTHVHTDEYVSPFIRAVPAIPQTSSTLASKGSPPISSPDSSSTSSPIHSPKPTLRRNYSSTFTLIPEDRAISGNEYHNHYNGYENHSNHKQQQQKRFRTNNQPSFLIYLLLWFPLVIIRLIHNLFSILIWTLMKPFRIVAPSFWLTAFLWILWKLLTLPLSIINSLSIVLRCSKSKNYHRGKRTVLLSCGSTIQTLHLARNFYSAGARVIVFDFDDLFGLARFSTAVHKYYTIPKLDADSPHEYIASLCDIVEKEHPTYYVPVCATSAAHYDALAKPHLELLGCHSFIPGTQEIYILDDILEIIRKCSTFSLPLPTYKVLTSKEDLYRLYETGWIRNFRNILIECGKNGTLERHKFILPMSLRDLKLTHEISDDKNWIVIRDLPGTHYVTCTTLKDSRVLTNVTCSIVSEKRILKPEHNDDVEKWLNDFFTKLRLNKPINGHISFRFVKCERTGNLLPLGTRVGISLPYICYTAVHSRILWKPCPHFSRSNSGPLVQDNARYWIYDILLNTLKHPSINSFEKLIDTVLDEREALFVYWDPLPYCAYYHFQLPFTSIKNFLQRRQKSRTSHVATM